MSRQKSLVKVGVCVVVAALGLGLYLASSLKPVPDRGRDKSDAAGSPQLAPQLGESQGPGRTWPAIVPTQSPVAPAVEFYVAVSGRVVVPPAGGRVAMDAPDDTVVDFTSSEGGVHLGSVESRQGGFDGRILVRESTRGIRAVATSRSAGLRSTSVMRPVERGVQFSFVLLLLESATVEVRAIDDGGKPDPTAAFLIREHTTSVTGHLPTWEAESTSEIVRRVPAAADGSVVVQVRAGGVSVRVLTPDGRVGMPVSRVIARGEHVDLGVLRTQFTSTHYKVTFLDELSGAPVPGVWVEISDRDLAFCGRDGPAPKTCFESGPDGVLSIDGLDASYGSISFSAGSERHAAVNLKLHAGREQVVRLARRAMFTVRVRSTSPRGSEGLIRDMLRGGSWQTRPDRPRAPGMQPARKELGLGPVAPEDVIGHVLQRNIVLAKDTGLEFEGYVDTEGPYVASVVLPGGTKLEGKVVAGSGSGQGVHEWTLANGRVAMVRARLEGTLSPRTPVRVALRRASGGGTHSDVRLEQLLAGAPIWIPDETSSIRLESLPSRPAFSSTTHELGRGGASDIIEFAILSSGEAGEVVIRVFGGDRELMVDRIPIWITGRAVSGDSVNRNIWTGPDGAARTTLPEGDFRVVSLKRLGSEQWRDFSVRAGQGPREVRVNVW